MSLRVSTKATPATPLILRAAALATPLLLAGCGASEGIGANFMPSKLITGTMSGPKEMDPAVYASTPVCPEALVRDGTEFMPVYEAGKTGNPDAVRFQASVQRVARDCDNAADGGITVRVGVAGRVLAGKTGATGTMTVPVRVAVTAGDKVLYSKLTTTQVTVQAPDYSALFSIVDDGINLSVAESQAATIYVGLDGKGEVGAPRRKKLVTK